LVHEQGGGWGNTGLGSRLGWACDPLLVDAVTTL